MTRAYDAAVIGTEHLDVALDAIPEVPGVREWARARATRIPYHTGLEIGLTTTDEPDWLCRGFVATQAITEIDGKVKAAGKTTFALHLVAAILHGEPFMGYATSPCKTVYLTEQQPAPFREALERAGLLQTGPDLRIVFRREVGHLAWPDLIAALVADATHDGYMLLVIDTLAKLAGIRDENDAAAAAAAMVPLQDAAHDGMAVVVCRHERKGGGSVGESARGSSAFSGDVDVIVQLRRPEGNQPSNRRVIETLSRYTETPEKVVVELVDEGYVLLGEAEAVAIADALRIVSALLGGEFGRLETGVTVDELVEASGLARTTVQRAIRELRKRGEVAESGRGIRGNPYRYSMEKESNRPNSEVRGGMNRKAAA